MFIVTMIKRRCRQVLTTSKSWVFDGCEKVHVIHDGCRYMMTAAMVVLLQLRSSEQREEFSASPNLVKGRVWRRNWQGSPVDHLAAAGAISSTGGGVLRQVQIGQSIPLFQKGVARLIVVALFPLGAFLVLPLA